MIGMNYITKIEKSLWEFSSQGAIGQEENENNKACKRTGIQGGLPRKVRRPIQGSKGRWLRGMWTRKEWPIERGFSLAEWNVTKIKMSASIARKRGATNAQLRRRSNRDRNRID